MNEFRAAFDCKVASGLSPILGETTEAGQKLHQKVMSEFLIIGH